MRILIDMPISPRTAEALRALGHEVSHVIELGLSRARDEEIVAAARSRGLTILTKDLDFAAILAADPPLEGGAIILRVGNWTREQTEERLKRVLAALEEETITNAIVMVDRSRVRIRRFPVQ